MISYRRGVVVKEEDSWEEARARAQAYGVYFLLPGWPVDRGRWEWQWQWWTLTITEPRCREMSIG
jgi:hypothetical protein